MLFCQRGNSKLSINLNLTSTIANHSPAPQKEGAGTLVFIQTKCWPEKKSELLQATNTILSVFANWQGIYPGMHYCKCKPSSTHVLGHAFHSSLFHPSLWTSWSFCTWKLTEEDANHQMHRGLICQGPWTSNPWLLGVANCGSEKKIMFQHGIPFCEIIKIPGICGYELPPKSVFHWFWPQGNGSVHLDR